MRYKKGFTLAEILIVLMVIGVLATLTIPSLMKGVQEAKYKTAYKKAFNNIANIMATETTTSGLPAVWKDDNNLRIYMYDVLRKHLSVKAWVSKNDFDINTRAALDKSKIQTDTPTGRMQWLIAEDGLAYTLFSGKCTTAGKCTKADINSKTTIADTIKTSIFVIVVDVNGLNSLPNNANLGNKAVNISSSTPMITGDQLYIYIGSDGATAGNPTRLITGRIINDTK